MITMLLTRARAAVPLAMLLILSQTGTASAAGVDLVKNGGFESGLAEWTPVSLNPFYPADVLFRADGIAYSGSQSLRVATVVDYQTEIRGEIYQVVQDPRLSLDSTLSFWIYPMFAADDVTVGHVWLYLVLQTTSQKQYRLAYHVAWETVAWPVYRDWAGNTSDTGDFFIRTLRYEWNYVQRDLRRDFESRFGPATGLGLSKVEIHIATSTKQPITPYRMGAEFIWWDEVRLVSTPPPKLDLSLAVYRSGTATTEAYVGEQVQVVASVSNPSETPAKDLTAEATYPKGVRQLSGNSPPSYLDPGSGAQLSWLVVADEPGDYTITVKVSSSAGTQSGQVSFSARAKPTPAPQVVTVPEPPQTGTYVLIAAVVLLAFALGVFASSKRRS